MCWSGEASAVLAASGFATLLGYLHIAFQPFCDPGRPLCGERLCSVRGEWPAIWCLLSIGILMLLIKTPLRRWLPVRQWLLWPRRWGDTESAGRTC